MIMALLIGLLLRGGRFLTLAARRTLWQIFEANECGPKILLDHENLLKLIRTTDAIHFGRDKDIQTINYEAISSCKTCYTCIGDGVLKNLNQEKTIPQQNNLEKLLDELERKLREVNVKKETTKDTDNVSKLPGYISNEPISLKKLHLKSPISDDFCVQFGKSRKYFKRITKHSNYTYNSLPDLASLSFYSCRSMHTRRMESFNGGDLLTVLKKPQEKQDAAIREMLNRKIKLLAEKKDKRKKRSVYQNEEMKERERLLEINQKAFKKVEDDLKTVKIINKKATSQKIVEVDELLALLEDSPKIHFLKNIKIHKQLPYYDSTTTAEFIVKVKPEEHKLNFERLQEEIKEAGFKQNGSNVRSMVQFLEYAQIPRVCHLNEQTLDNEIKWLVNTKKTNTIMQINREGEKLNKMKLQEEIIQNFEMKMSTIKETNTEVKKYENNIKEQKLLFKKKMKNRKDKQVKAKGSAKKHVRSVAVKKLNRKRLKTKKFAEKHADLKVANMDGLVIEKEAEGYLKDEKMDKQEEEIPENIKLKTFKEELEEEKEKDSRLNKTVIISMEGSEISEKLQSKTNEQTELNVTKEEETLSDLTAKSRIPVRKIKCSETMDTANKTIRKIALQKSGRVTLIPKGCCLNRKKLRPLQKASAKLNKIKSEENNATIEVAEKKSLVKAIKESESDVLKKLLNKNLNGKSESDMNIENELPPDFDVLKEAEIPTDEDERLEMPTQKKYSVVDSEKDIADSEYCSDATKKGKNLQALLLDDANNRNSTAREIPTRKTKSTASIQKCAFWNRQPKPESNSDTTNKTDKGKDEDLKKKQERIVKKYKMVTDEIEAIGGGKLKVTKLVEDV